MLCTIFGCTNLSFLRPYEIVYRSSNVTVVHLASFDRIKNLFTWNKVNPFQYTDGSNNYTVTAKLFLIDKRSGTESLGCCTHEDKETLTVLLESGWSTVLPRPFYSNVERSWQLTHNDDYMMEQYHPVRFKITQNGTVNLTINRFLSENSSSNFSNVIKCI